MEDRCVMCDAIIPEGTQVCGKCREENMGSQNILKKLKEYEDLEEQGLLLRLPCPIGTTVYNIIWWDDTTESVVVNGKKYYRNIKKRKITKSVFTLMDLSRWNEEVFLTKEEAEQKLAEMRGGEKWIF